MSNLFWSGPGRALQCHLDLFGMVDRTYKWYQANENRSVRIETIPSVLRQRLRLMSSMGAVGPQVIVDGHTVAVDRDAPNQLHSTYNLARTTGLLTQEHEILNKGETHYVSHNIMATVASAAEQADDEPLFPTDLPCPTGLAVFEYPLLIPDLHPDTGETVPGLEMPVRAIGWTQATVWAKKGDGADVFGPHLGAAPDVFTDEMEALPGVTYVLYTDDDAYMKLFIPSVKREIPDVYTDDYDLALAEDHDSMWCIDVSGWSFGKSWKRAGTDSPRDAFAQGDIHDTVAYVRRFILSLFRFEWSRIIVPQVYKPSRHEHRQAMRAGMKLEDGYIKVLRLRRHVEAEARGETIDSDQLAYDHAWMVRGHWRRQHHPKLGPARNEDGSFNHDSHRLIWIEPHVKGNPFAPLIVGHNVTALVR